MRIAKIGVLVLTTVGVVTPPTLCSGQNAPIAWPEEQLKAAIAGCRASIIDHATRDYLARAHLTADQLPPDFPKLFEKPEFESFLRTCDCSIGIISKEIPYDQFQASPPQVQQRVKELVSPGGVCAPKPGT